MTPPCEWGDLARVETRETQLRSTIVWFRNVSDKSACFVKLLLYARPFRHVRDFGRRTCSSIIVASCFPSVEFFSMDNLLRSRWNIVAVSWSPTGLRGTRNRKLMLKTKFMVANDQLSIRPLPVRRTAYCGDSMIRRWRDASHVLLEKDHAQFNTSDKS